MSGSNNLINTNFPLDIANGGTGKTSVTTAPTSTAWAGWDSNQNISANSFIAGYTSTATAGSTTTLSVSSHQQQFFTGTSNQTVVLPVVSTLVLGQTFLIVNNSTGTLTVQSSGGNTIQAMATNTQAVLTCISTSGTGAASWNCDYQPETIGVSSITGTTNQITASAPTGAVTLSLPNSVKINTSILDSNSNTMLDFVATASAVNYIQLINKQTGNGPYICSIGADSTVNMNLQSHGSGSAVQIQADGAGLGQLRLINGSGNYAGFAVQSGTTSYTMNMPTAQGAANTTLVNDGSGNLTWGTNVGTGYIQYTSGSISSSQILNLNSTPITLVAAQGAHTVILVSQFALEYIYGTSDYSSTAFGVYYGTTTPPLACFSFTGASLASSQSSFVSTPGFVLPGGGITGTACSFVTNTLMINQALVLWAPGANPTSGDGTFVYHLWYRVIGTTL